MAKQDDPAPSGDGAIVPLEVFEALPKTDLHVHLDGSLRLSTIIDIAKE
jgi:adenosine deaminase